MICVLRRSWGQITSLLIATDMIYNKSDFQVFLVSYQSAYTSANNKRSLWSSILQLTVVLEMKSMLDSASFQLVHFLHFG